MSIVLKNFHVNHFTFPLWAAGRLHSFSSNLKLCTYLLSFDNSHSDMWGYLIFVLICISLIGDTEHLFMSVDQQTAFLKCSCRKFVHFFIQVVCWLFSFFFFLMLELGLLLCKYFDTNFYQIYIVCKHLSCHSVG